MPDGARSTTFETVVLVHLEAAYRLASYLCRRSDIAEDIVQEAILRAYRGFDNQRGDNVRAWLLTIVRNCFLTWSTRDRERSGIWNLTDPTELAAIAPREEEDHGTPESLLIQNEDNNAIRAAVEGLPHLFKEVLVLRDIEDMSYRDIAEITGAPIGTVMSRLARARKMFAAAWKGPEAGPQKEKLS